MSGDCFTSSVSSLLTAVHGALNVNIYFYKHKVPFYLDIHICNILNITHNVQCMYLTAGVRVVAVRVADVPAALLPLPGQPEHHRPGVEARCWVPVVVVCMHLWTY